MIGPPEQEDTVLVDHLTVRYRHVTACDAVSLRIRPGSIYALLGKSGAGKSSVVRCVLGQLKPAAGRVLVLGQDAWRHRRKVRRSVQAISAETDAPRIALALAAEPRLLVLDDPALGPGIECRAAVQEELAAASRRGTAILFATGTPSDVERIADRVGILNRGSLVLDEDIAVLRSRFRRIRYRSEVTLTRTEYGNELDLFDAVRVRVRGWGVEAIVSNYSQDTFERFRLTDGVVGAEEALMTLSEIFEAVSPDRTATESSKP